MQSVNNNNREGKPSLLKRRKHMNTFQHESKSITSEHYRLFKYRKADKYIIKLASGEYKIYRNSNNDWSLLGVGESIIYRSNPQQLMSIIEQTDNNVNR